MARPSRDLTTQKVEMAELSLHGRTKGNDLPAVEDPEAAQTVRLVPADERNPDASSVIIQVTTVSPTNDVRQIGHYAVEQVLNHGGMGVVYKAFDTRLKRPVAVKMILAGAHADPATLARFRGEAEAVALLQHANIVQIHEVAEHGGMPYLAFEFVEGENLQRVVSQRAFSPRDAASLTRTLARAVEFAHQRGIIHRDLKPGNILITPGGVPKITDFGLAKLKGSHDTHTRPGEVIGTPNYMAPEQAEGDSEVIGPSADIYSLGAVLYELLTGQPPFHGTSPMETLLRVKLSSPIPPRHLRPKLPADLETICLKCLEKDPAARYSCAEALAEDLDRFLDGRPIHARPAGPAEHAWKWARRHPTVSVLAFGLATWVVVSYCLFLVQWRDVQRARVELASQAGELNSARAELDVERRAAATARRMADESRRHADWVSYLLQLNAAEREYTTYDAAKARDLLDHCPVALRSWEWHYLRRRIEGSAVTVPLQQGEFLALAGLRGGREIATVANDGRVIRRSVDNGLTVGEVRLGWNAGGRLEAIPARATFSSDGSMIAADCFVRDGAGTAGAHVAVWATATGKLIRAWPAAGAAVRLTFAPDGKRLARLTGEWREVRGHAGWHGGSLALYSLETGSSAWRTELPADSNGYTDVAFDQTPTQLVLTRADKPLTFIDANNGKFVREIGSRAAGGGGICVSHRGPVRYAVRDGSAVNLFDETVKQVGTLTGHSGLLTDARLSDDGRQIITCANDHTLRVWDAESRRTTAVLAGHTATVSTADDVGAGRIASLAQDGQLKIWDVNGVEPHLDTKVVHEWTPAVAFGPDGKWLVSGSGDGQIIVWDVAARKRIKTLHVKGSVMALALTADGKTLVAGTNDPHDLALMDPMTGEVFKRLDPGHVVLTLAFSRDEQQLLVTGEDGFAAILDINDGRVIDQCRIHADSVMAGAFNPKANVVASGGRDGVVRIWGPGRVRPRTIKAHDSPVSCLAFSPNGQWLATANSSRDHPNVPVAIRIWNAETGEMVREMKGHDQSVWCLCWHPDGSRLVSGSEDKTVKVWEPMQGQLLLTFKGHTDDVRCVTFSPDGGLLVSSNDDPWIRIWDGTKK